MLSFVSKSWREGSILIKSLSVLVQQMRQRIQIKCVLGISLCSSVMYPPKTQLI